VQQGCDESPLLFNLYMAELEERLKRRGIGEIRGRLRFLSLAYADDVVLIAKNRDAMQDMRYMYVSSERILKRWLDLNG